MYFCNRARAQLELNKNQECIEDCTKALELEPENVKVIYRYAKALVNQGKVVEAMSLIDKVKKANLGGGAN